MPRTREPGITQRSNGKWQARYYDLDGKQHARDFARQADAIRWRRSQLSALQTGQWVDPTGPRTSFETYVSGWLESKRLKAPGTFESYGNAVRVHIRPTFGKRQIGSIRRSDVQEWVNHLNNDLAPATVEQKFNVLRMIFRSAVLDRVVHASPCERIELPKIEPKRVEPLPTTQVEALIAATPERWRAAVVLGAAAGLRQAETLGLTVPRVDFLRRRLRVEQQMWTPGKGSPFLKALKTEASPRTIPLPEVAITALSEHLRRWPAENESRLIFPHPSGTAGMKRQRFCHIISTAVKNAGVRKGTTYHDLRHYYASLPYTVVSR